MVQAGQHDRAEIAAQETVQLGISARRRGDRSAALMHFRAALAADLAGIRSRVELARELTELGRPHEAEALLRSVLEDAPGQPQAHALLAYLVGPSGSRPG